MQYLNLINILKHREEEIFLSNKVRESLSKYQNINHILNNYHEELLLLAKNFIQLVLII